MSKALSTIMVAIRSRRSPFC